MVIGKVWVPQRERPAERPRKYLWVREKDIKYAIRLASRRHVISLNVILCGIFFQRIVRISEKRAVYSHRKPYQRENRSVVLNRLAMLVLYAKLHQKHSNNSGKKLAPPARKDNTSRCISRTKEIMI